MFLLLEISKATRLEAFAVLIPESMGLLALGVGLVLVAVMLRSFFARSEIATNEKGTPEEI